MSSASSPARPSASLVIINSQNEILFVHRNPQSRSFGGVYVFPGGNFDSAHDTSLVDTAIRETFEETGLLIASGSSLPDDATLDAARKAIHANQTTWPAFLSKHALKPNKDALLPFTQWITPKFAARRFQTQFYVTYLNNPRSSFTGTREERLPTPDGGLEVLAAGFLAPATALDLFAKREITLMPPQFYITKTLAELGGARADVERLAKSAFGRQVINPVRIVSPDVAAGKVVLTYEGDEARGGPAGRRHRAVVKMDKAGITSEIELIRNFDLFTEVAEHTSKL
ncbi:Nudix hydrolase domain-containing protein [Mycena kentingensis (nom. inval.)]|nr:Nudix hydrolase domain-containing protein [Mycena kentingensis (nom. inval.)]